MTIFSEKLSRIAETISLAGERPAAGLAHAICDGRGFTAIAIGSGGSAVAAEFFARCRTTLGLGPTFVMTPMQFVLSSSDWPGVEVWLFSAGANNPDVSAAFRAATASRCRSIGLVTASATGATAVAASRHPLSRVFVTPVADPKDGFLATHSMVSMVAALLFACDATTESPMGRVLVDDFLAETRSALAEGGAFVREALPGDTVVVLHDPQVAAAAVLIETCLWETGIAPVQRTDFRNFAHGRHVWAAKHPNAMFVLALTTRESEVVWRPVSSALPAEVRQGGLGLGHGGRLMNAIGILRGLAIVSRLGEISGVDPGRPGRGPFAEAIYDDDALEELAAGLTAAVRHKAAAGLLHDHVRDGGKSRCAAGRERLRSLGAATFVGLTLDYDGTVVPNRPREARLGPPAPEVMDELVRLVDAGIQVGFATGRGGSAGEKLRSALPERIHRLVLIGYYNGAHIRTLDVDIRSDRPQRVEGVSAFALWIGGSGLLRGGAAVTAGEVQATIAHEDVVAANTFVADVAGCPEVSSGAVRVLSSHHSFDVLPTGTSKLRVVEELARRAGRPGGVVLGVGDSGSLLGNDHELLSGGHGLSVDSVCGDDQGAWTLFGSRLGGPEALARILRAARCASGGLTIDLSALDLDQDG